MRVQGHTCSRGQTPPQKTVPYSLVPEKKEKDHRLGPKNGTQTNMFYVIFVLHVSLFKNMSDPVKKRFGKAAETMMYYSTPGARVQGNYCLERRQWCFRCHDPNELARNLNYITFSNDITILFRNDTVPRRNSLPNEWIRGPATKTNQQNWLFGTNISSQSFEVQELRE